MRKLVSYPLFILACIIQSSAQDRDHMNMSGMNAPRQHQSLVDIVQHHAISGTDVEPISTPMEMVMSKKGAWSLMFHGEIFLNTVQQTGPRGGDKFFSTNWFMPMAQRKLGAGTLTLRSMFSLEPATVTDRRYPELFQQGETAYGSPIVDGQHPHDFFMELAALYDLKLKENVLLSFYAAPVGDPAFGPPAYPHRASASENPVAPLGHHFQDSTHIADEVVTVGLTYRNFRIEASGFHGREPNEYRWDIDTGRINSWSTRLTASPGRNWSVQYSITQLDSPETLAPRQDVRCMTASIIYNRPMLNANWTSMLLWGRNQSLADGNLGNSYLLESTLKLRRNTLWGRIENADRTNELLLGKNPLPPGFTERYFTRVQAYTAGYDREIRNFTHLSTAIGGQFSWYGVPDVLKPAYGPHPVGILLFLRARVK